MGAAYLGRSVKYMLTLDEVFQKLVIGNALDGIELSDRPDFFVINVTESVENPKADFCLTIGVPRTADEKIRVFASDLDILANMIDSALYLNQHVLVHCTAGIERSPLVVTWYLHKYFNMSLLDAFYEVQQNLRPEAENRLNWISYLSVDDFLKHTN